jgi:hypothetical protein
MPDWLTTSLASGPSAAPLPLAWRIGVALVLGVAVAGLYRWARRGEEIPPTFQTTLVLLAALIAMATQIIGDNIARAFSLVGALSVVRFRTVVKDTQDTAFVIFAVVVGMAAGANHLAVGLVGLVVVGIASLALWPPGRGNGWQGPGVTLSMRVGLADGIRAAAEATLAASAEHYDLVSAGTARQGSSLDLAYRVRLRPGCSPAGLVAELNGLAGVESVQLSRDD